MTLCWTAMDAMRATGGSGPEGWVATDLSIDSRSCNPGDLFIALKGPNHDGHDHVASALAAGAVAAMVQHWPQGVPEKSDVPLLQVPDTQIGLESLGKAGRDRFDGRLIALTGSVGKTGTKEMLRHILAHQGDVSATRGNLNNEIGAPLTLARLPARADFGVIELGMNHAGEIGPLSRMARPHVAMITRIAPAHTAFFASLDEVAVAKAEIFEGVEAGGAAIVNADDGFAGRLTDLARAAGVTDVLRFGEAADADARLAACDLQADGSDIEADILGRHVSYRLGAPGLHWVQNSLAALTAVACVGADVRQAAEALADIRPPAGRGATEHLQLPQGGIVLIDESYNASPAAMRAAFSVLTRHTPTVGGRRIAILGDMLELGANARFEHESLGEVLSRLPIETVFAAGPEMAALVGCLRADQKAGYAADTVALAAAIVPALNAGDVVLVKGSLGIGMARIVNALRAAALDKGKADAL